MKNSLNVMNKIDRRRKPLLILECDATKLDRQNLALGNELQNYVKIFFPQNPVILIRSDTEAELAKAMAELFETGQSCRNIVIIGHSNKGGLKISADRFVQWEAVANWLIPFAPQRIILIACEVGRWLPCAALFKGIPNLKEIFGSPIPAHKDQKYIVLARVLHLLGAKNEDANFIILLQLGNFLLTKGVMFQRTRSEYEQGNEEE